MFNAIDHYEDSLGKGLMAALAPNFSNVFAILCPKAMLSKPNRAAQLRLYFSSIIFLSALTLNKF